jgi:hypothetical protein
VSRFELEIWDDESEKVTFYTVKWEGAEFSETDKFFDKYQKINKSATQELLSLLVKAIGTDHGAIESFFNRPEDGVTGLPPKGRITVDEVKFHYPNFPLRLYALRINDREDLVVLFNGGAKSAQTNQESPDLNLKFKEATSFGKRIEQALQEGMIVIDDNSRTLKSFDGSSVIVL